MTTNMAKPRRSRRRTVLGIGAVVLVAVVAFAGYRIVHRLSTDRVTGYFTSTTGLYVGDDVRVLGVPIGRIDKIEPGPKSAKVVMSIDSSVKVPADAKAVIVAPTLVSARFIQLAPAYTGGPRLRDGAEIPLARTAVPVEWDEVKTELGKLSDALGPTADKPSGSLGRALDTAAANLDGGNAASVREALRQLSQTMGVLSDGRQDLFSTVRNLQQFVTALSNSNTQIVQFGGRLASVSQVLANSSTELGSALNSLDGALGQVKGFLDTNTPGLTESVGRLADATQVLADKRDAIAKVLHIAPTSLVNFYQIYKPAQGSLTGALALNQFRNPVTFLCGAVEAMKSNDSQRSADLCRQYLSPVLNSLTMNYPPILLNPATGQHAYPDQLRFSPPSLQASTVPRSLGALMMPGVGR